MIHDIQFKDSCLGDLTIRYIPIPGSPAIYDRFGLLMEPAESPSIDIVSVRDKEDDFISPNDVDIFEVESTIDFGSHS
jgi:hypothetical protein